MLRQHRLNKRWLWCLCALLVMTCSCYISVARAAAYDDNDLCGLHTLLILEQAQQHPKADYTHFYRGIVAELVNSDLLHGQPNNRKITLLNEAQHNAAIVYPQRHALSSSARYKALKHRLWQHCSKRLSHS